MKKISITSIRAFLREEKGLFLCPLAPVRQASLRIVAEKEDHFRAIRNS